MTEDELAAIVKQAKKYDAKNKPKNWSWTAVPDDQVARLFIGAGFIEMADSGS